MPSSSIIAKTAFHQSVPAEWCQQSWRQATEQAMPLRQERAERKPSFVVEDRRAWLFGKPNGYVDAKDFRKTRPGDVDEVATFLINDMKAARAKTLVIGEDHTATALPLVFSVVGQLKAQKEDVRLFLEGDPRINSFFKAIYQLRDKDIDDQATWDKILEDNYSTLGAIYDDETRITDAPETLQGDPESRRSDDFIKYVEGMAQFALHARENGIPVMFIDDAMERQDPCNTLEGMRDNTMSSMIAQERARHPKSTFVILSGALHAMKEKKTIYDQSSNTVELENTMVANLVANPKVGRVHAVFALGSHVDEETDRQYDQIAENTQRNPEAKRCETKSIVNVFRHKHFDRVVNFKTPSGD